MEFELNVTTDINKFINDELAILNSNNDNNSEDEDNYVFNSKISTEFQIVVDRAALENLIKTAASEAKRKSKN